MEFLQLTIAALLLAVSVSAEPEYRKKSTALETLVANRESLAAWERSQDREALATTEIKLGPWHVLGPLAPDSPLINKLLNQMELHDLKLRYSDGGTEYGWEPCPEFKEEEICDLTGVCGATKDSVFILCRSAELGTNTSSRSLVADLSLSKGMSHWLPGRNERNTHGVFPVLPGKNPFNSASGTSQLFAVVEPDSDGRRLCYFSVKSNVENMGAGAVHQRAERRRTLLNNILIDFPEGADQKKLEWDIAGNIWLELPDYRRQVNDWVPGQSKDYLRVCGRAAREKAALKLKELIAQTNGVSAIALAPRRELLLQWLEKFSSDEDANPASGMDAYYRICAVQEALSLLSRSVSMRLAVKDQQSMFKERYPQAKAALASILSEEKKVAVVWDKLLAGSQDALQALLARSQAVDALQSDLLLNTPLLDFDSLLFTKGDIGFSSNWGGPNRIGTELNTLSPVRPDGKVTTLHKGMISDYDLNWDGKRILFSDRQHLWELDLSVTGAVPRRVSAEKPDVNHYDGCYLPNGKIVAACNACYQAVPCTGEANVGNLHLMDADGGNERRITFDQDHDWNPTVMNDGRVLYTRWEYADIPHYFSRFLMRMNPDGSGQMEYYGSGSYWPNSMFWPRPIPGDPNAVVCIVSGHHGVSRAGEIVIFNPLKGRHEASGVVQRIPGYERKVVPVMMDRLVDDLWPRFAAPYPLAEPGSDLGAGKYFLAAMKRSVLSGWDLCLVDIFDNVTPLLKAERVRAASPWSTEGYMSPVPMRQRVVPPALPSMLNPDQPDGVIYLVDIYKGRGLRGYPRGSIKALRIGTHHYRYFGNGGTYTCSYEGGWDVKRILGTVPVNEDGSASFRVPANTPIFVQPLDADGKAQQQMRSWYTAMPGETAACVGCHEPQNSTPPGQINMAMKKSPSVITPWNGPERGFSFEHEIQPILNRHCVGCHSDKPYVVKGASVHLEDFRDKRLRPYEPELIPNECNWWGWLGSSNKHLEQQPDFYSPSYMLLQKYFRRAGYEADLHMFSPAEFDADTSVLVQMLKKGHHEVELTRSEWESFYTWVDFNLPYSGTWRESACPPNEEHVKLRAEYKKLYAGIDDRDEELRPVPPIGAFLELQTPVVLPAVEVKSKNWPISHEKAVALQKAAGEIAMEIDLGDAVKMKFALIPAGEFVMGAASGFADEMPQSVVAVDKAFYMGTLEVTCAQYARFDATHENGYIEGRNKDRTTRGSPIGASEQPVVRISWDQAMEFCEWLSGKSGLKCTLPTEAQWEWACRAGSATPFASGAALDNYQANIADESIRRWNYGRAQSGYTDGGSFSIPGGKYKPNGWGLYDMHGNVAEWTLSDYLPYPFVERNSTAAGALKTVRGGSWNDTMAYVTSASRWRYPRYQPVYNVGFRVLVEK